MYQKVFIVGHCGSNPEMKYTPKGDPVTQFSVASTYQTANTKETTWFRVNV